MQNLASNSTYNKQQDYMAEEINTRELEEYRRYLEALAENNSTDMFSNGGIKHASILMSVLFQGTKKAQIYCEGFKPMLIGTDPYWTALNKYLLEDSANELDVLVESDNYIEEKPLQTLKEAIERRNNETIRVKKISAAGKQLITNRFGKGHCNFAVFDDKKFRFEYDPYNYKAFGSFNQPDKCEILAKLFNEAFDLSTPLWQN